MMHSRQLGGAKHIRIIKGGGGFHSWEQWATYALRAPLKE